MCKDDIFEMESKHSYVKETDDNKHDWRNNDTNNNLLFNRSLMSEETYVIKSKKQAGSGQLIILALWMEI